MLALIVAMSENHVIGRGGALPWHLPNDLRRFKMLTTGHAIIMGRKTFESIGQPLPGRRNLVVTSRKALRADGVEIAPSLDEAIRLASGGRGGADEFICIIGGGEIFREALPRADRIYLTLVHADVEGDVTFPDVDFRAWRPVDDERHSADERHAFDYSFRLYERRPMT